jgi:hypothetical protein
MKEPKGLLDEMLERLDSGQVKPRVREYIGLENAIKNAKRKKAIIIAVSRKRKKLEGGYDDKDK